MKNFSTWMLVMVMVMFWVFRVIVAVMPEFGTTLGGIAPLNQNLEIILSFVVLVIYLLAYGMYFGVDVINNIQTVLNGASMETALNVFISIIGIILPIAVLADLLLDKGRKANPKDKKTDWFYNNEQFDRKLDERSDKNNYRTL